MPVFSLQTTAINTNIHILLIVTITQKSSLIKAVCIITTTGYKMTLAVHWRLNDWYHYKIE